MKTMKFNSIAIVLIALFAVTSCTKDWLDVEPKGTFLESNYYQTPDQAFSALTACYSVLTTNSNAGGWTQKEAGLAAAADETLCGGPGGDFQGWLYWDSFTANPGNGPQLAYWIAGYQGVYRTNVFLQKIDGVQGLADNVKKRYIAEAKFLRAKFYFDLVRLFGNIPLFTEALTLETAYQQGQVAPALVYAQIEKDLKDAIPDLPLTVPAATEGGRPTQGAGKALLGKVILTQMDKNRMLEAANLLEDVNKSGNVYGYKLMAKYGDIFGKANKFNSESIFEIDYNGGGGYSFAVQQGNLWSAAMAPAGFTGPIYYNGFGTNPIELTLVNDMKGDPRYKYTIVNIDSLVNATPGATYTKGFQNTGYFVAKWQPKVADLNGFYFFNWPYNYIEMRLADTYLMEAEALIRGGGDAAKAASYLNAVRARVGLPPVAATLDNILKERRLELATEGSRFFDLIRFGKATEVLGSKGFTAGKNEVLPIPIAELKNTQLKQNPNY